MKKIYAILMMAAAMTACRQMEQPAPIEEQEKPQEQEETVQTFTMTIEASKGIDTKALSLSGENNKTLSATWAQGEEVTAFEMIDYGASYDELGTLTAQDNGASTTLSGKINKVPSQGNNIMLCFPRYPMDYTGQKGTMADIAANFDYAYSWINDWTESGGRITATSTAVFENQQAIVRFILKDINGTPINASSLTISDALGNLLQSTDFASYANFGDLTINLDTPSSEVWVAMLAQWNNSMNLTLTADVDGVIYTYNKNDVTFDAGQYYQVTVKMTPKGAVRGLFTVNDDGKKIYFSQGNLKYSNGTWSFHTNQYDMCFTEEGDVSENYTASGTFDLFGWGTSGYDVEYPYLTSSDYGQYIQGDDIAGTEYDWGVHNTISNGGTGWRTLTRDEWDYLLYQRTTTSDVRYMKATVNDVAGLIILPDDWSTSYYDFEYQDNNPYEPFSTLEIELSDWTSALEAHGAVFLPVFGFRDDNTAIPQIGGVLSYYWSSTYYGYDSGPGSECSYYLTLGEYYDDYYQSVVNYVSTDTYGPTFAGAFVRLVRDAN